jgi:hypothetical protein
MLEHAKLEGFRTELPMAEQLRVQGYAYAPGRALRTSGELRTALGTWLDGCQDLPLDEYAPDGTRHRCYDRFYLLAPSRPLSRQAPEANGYNTYFQAQTFNPVNGGQQRRFKALPADLAESVFLHQLIRFDYAQTDFSVAQRSRPIEVGIHTVKMRALPGRPGVSSPNRLHKDGEHYTFIHLLERTNVTGGQSVIADNSLRPVFEVTLEQCLDTVAVRDDAVYHHVEPVHVQPPASQGHRIVVIIDFTPLRPDISN